MIDGHVHLENGPLTKEYVYKFVNEAINKGIKKLQIVDHTFRYKEFLPIHESFRKVKAQDEWINNEFKDSIYDFIKLIEEMKKEKLQIEVLFGLEVDYQKSEEIKIKELLKIYDFDILIGSVHFIDGIAYDSEWSLDELWNKYPVNDIYKKYYDEVFSMVKSGLFTQLGHPDTIKMYNYYPSYDLTDTYNKLAELAKEHNIIVENNVGCYYRYNHKDMGLSKELLEIFKKHQCKMITATDAHYPKDVGRYIKDVWDITMN